MATPAPTDTTPLGQARQYLREHVDYGEKCPCCNQMAKVYRRQPNAQMAHALIRLYRAAGIEWGHWPTIMGRKQADEAKLRYWGLIEEETERRPDGGRAGWWRITPAGEEWVRGRSTVPRYCRVYDSKPLRLEGEPWSIRDALGKRFDYTELMAGV